MSEIPYPHVTDADLLLGLNDAEISQGYSDGLHGEPAPTGNRSLAYAHGWRNGNCDRNRMSTFQQLELIQDMRRKGVFPFTKSQS